jgi:hypothetical protein
MDRCADCRHERELREQWQREHEIRHTAMEEARRLAAIEIERRLEGMNELRAQISNERGMYLTRDLYDREHALLRDTLDTRVKILESARANLDGRLWALGAVVTGVVSFVVIAVNLLVRWLGN